ncbi:MAG TPA: ABC transporter ATP-binding protein, partial [Anaerolineales bacterium]|nr:ABC transporter ATP-binding protein [Anaerolineales bacterium]
LMFVSTGNAKHSKVTFNFPTALFLLFSYFALFPHLDVNDNVAFGVEMRRLPQAEIAERVASSLAMVSLGGFEKRRVTELSGGEQQRVALARALAIRPRLLMFDEPLGALDRTLREDLLNELRTILHRTSIPAIYVTHDQEEAFTIADRILILHDGEITREGTPADVWADPMSAFAADFLGLGNVIQGKVREKKKEGSWEVESDFGMFSVTCGHEHQKGEEINLLARPLPVEQDGNVIAGIVSDVIFQQDRFKVTLDNGLYVFLPEAPEVREKIEVRVRIQCLA